MLEYDRIEVPEGTNVKKIKGLPRVYFISILILS